MKRIIVIITMMVILATVTPVHAAPVQDYGTIRVQVTSFDPYGSITLDMPAIPGVYIYGPEYSVVIIQADASVGWRIEHLSSGFVALRVWQRDDSAIKVHAAPARAGGTGRIEYECAGRQAVKLVKLSSFRGIWSSFEIPTGCTLGRAYQVSGYMMEITRNTFTRRIVIMWRRP